MVDPLYRDTLDIITPSAVRESSCGKLTVEYLAGACAPRQAFVIRDRAGRIKLWLDDRAKRSCEVRDIDRFDEAVALEVKSWTAAGRWG